MFCEPQFSYRYIYVVERITKAEVKEEEQSKKAEYCLEDLWNETHVERALMTEIDTRTEQKGVGKLVGLCRGHRLQHPHYLKVSLWGHKQGKFETQSLTD